jgi:hypothetical protein
LLLAAVALAACESCETGGSRPAEPVAEAPGVEAPGVEAATPAPEQAPKEGEADCFVIVDAEPDLGAPPLRVVFETEIDCTAGPVTYRWDFGDGAAGRNEANPIHVYEKAGDFIATVTVTAPDGGVGSDEIDITVDELLGD